MMPARPKVPQSSNGIFITLEGGEGAGKTSLAEKLKYYLQEHNIEVILTHEPGGTAGGKDIRQLLTKGEADRWDPVCEALLFYAARRDHVEKLIKPALKAGKWVICDRFSDSTVVYQGIGQNLALKWLKALEHLALDDFSPDLTLVIDVCVEIGLERVRNRNIPDRFEQRDSAFHETLRHGFLKIAQENPGRCRLLDGQKAPDKVYEEASALVRQQFRDWFL